jgi:multimeric flavodoxin WrbA
MAIDVLSDSLYGHVRRLAVSLQAGLEAAGVKAELFQV